MGEEGEEGHQSGSDSDSNLCGATGTNSNAMSDHEDYTQTANNVCPR